MVQINTVARRFGGLMAGLVLWLSPVVAVQAEDDYLSLLEAEATDTGAGNEPAEVSNDANTPNKKTKNMKADKMIEQGLSFEAFEETLSSRYSGSNFLYVKLSEKDACKIEHALSTKTSKRLAKFVEFVQSSETPEWLKGFNFYIKTGKRSECKYKRKK